MAAQKVEATLGGVFKQFLKNLGGLGSAIGAGINQLMKWGVEVDKDPTENDKGEKVFYFRVPGEDHLQVIAKPVEDKPNTFDFEFIGKDTNLHRTEDKNIKIDDDKDFEELFKKVMYEEWGFKNLEDWERLKEAEAGTKVLIKKVVSDSEVSVQLHKIACGTDVVRAVAMVDNVIQNDDFVESIPEEGQAYILQDDGDEIDVQECECVPDTNPYIDLLSAAICTRNLFQYLHWNCKGRKFNDLHTYLDEAIDKIQDDIDIWGELSVEYFGYVPHPSSLNCGDSLLDIPGGIDGMDGFAVVKDAIHLYVSCIEYITCSGVVGDDVQSLMDDIVRGWNKEANYFIARRLLK